MSTTDTQREIQQEGIMEHGSGFRKKGKRERSGTGEVGGLYQCEPFEMAVYVKNQEK